ncbi:MAG: hypothetical protein JOZ89_09230, partial [Gammaproteobacteria bacterium]|nr:hypothetical protein [Gammaproteobacteria bacterium]
MRLLRAAHGELKLLLATLEPATEKPAVFPPPMPSERSSLLYAKLRRGRRRRRALPVLGHGANEARPVPNLYARVDGLLVEHERGQLAGIVVGWQIDIMRLGQPVTSAAQIDSIGPDRGNAELRF